MQISRDEKIIKYVEINPWCTKTKVINYINPTSPGPTEKALKRLIHEEKKLISEKDKSNSQIHRLHINDKNAFIIIYSKLTEIEAIMRIMKKPVKEVSDKGERLWEQQGPVKTKGISSGSQNLANLMQRFTGPYNDAVRLMLNRLLVHIDKTIISENDRNILYLRTAQLMLELHQQKYDLDWMLKVHVQTLQSFANALQSNSFGLKSATVDDVDILVNVIADFDKDIAA